MICFYFEKKKVNSFWYAFLFSLLRTLVSMEKFGKHGERWGKCLWNVDNARQIFTEFVHCILTISQTKPLSKFARTKVILKLWFGKCAIIINVVLFSCVLHFTTLEYENEHLLIIWANI